MFRRGQFGFIEAPDDPDIFTALFAAAEAWLKARGCTTALGPVNLSTNEEVGLLVEGAEGWADDLQAIGTEGDFSFLAFPQGGGVDVRAGHPSIPSVIGSGRPSNERSSSAGREGCMGRASRGR